MDGLVQIQVLDLFLQVVSTVVHEVLFHDSIVDFPVVFPEKESFLGIELGLVFVDQVELSLEFLQVQREKLADHWVLPNAGLVEEGLQLKLLHFALVEHFQVVVDFEGKIDQKLVRFVQGLQVGFLLLGAEVVQDPFLLLEFVGEKETLDVVSYLRVDFLFFPREDKPVQVSLVVGFLEVENGLPSELHQLLATSYIVQLFKEVRFSVLENFVLSLDYPEKDLTLINLLMRQTLLLHHSLLIGKASVHLSFPHEDR